MQEFAKTKNGQIFLNNVQRMADSLEIISSFIKRIEPPLQKQLDFQSTYVDYMQEQLNKSMELDDENLQEMSQSDVGC